MFIHFGAAVRLAFIDVIEKATRIRENTKLLIAKGYIKQGSAASLYLEDFIDKESELGIMMMNGGYC